ncbi:arsenate reductase ArsC [Gilvimarinus sp. DA14]|uniref:arsenate reductase ArsC n=1 Tax=Gilvimarinus sp. DA14 TaxID=2956798 RepID=UPI0020B847E7|nr:arsenate reductase ArsC [Gilvimarinus sp. DA14]UTF58748.1 arsenate reductase ArsC [Gilvimarinus sp. DA14]
MKKLLFVCTHNACRSVLAEVTANRLGEGRLQAASAGSQPAGRIHPLTVEYLQGKGIDTDELKSQSWDDFADYQPDLVITVCDSAAGEACPLWMGDAAKAHWGLPDPSRAADSASAFDAVVDVLERRIGALLKAPLEELTSAQLTDLANQVGEQEVYRD